VHHTVGRYINKEVGGPKIKIQIMSPLFKNFIRPFMGVLEKLKNFKLFSRKHISHQQGKKDILIIRMTLIKAQHKIKIDEGKFAILYKLVLTKLKLLSFSLKWFKSW